MIGVEATEEVADKVKRRSNTLNINTRASVAICISALPSTLHPYACSRYVALSRQVVDKLPFVGKSIEPPPQRFVREQAQKVEYENASG